MNLIAAVTSLAFADTPPHKPGHPTAASSGVDIYVPAVAEDAVATADRFSVALSCGDLVKAGKAVTVLSTETMLLLRRVSA